MGVNQGKFHLLWFKPLYLLAGDGYKAGEVRLSRYGIGMSQGASGRGTNWTRAGKTGDMII